MGKLEVGTLDKAQGTQEQTDGARPAEDLPREGRPPRVVQLPLFEEG